MYIYMTIILYHTILYYINIPGDRLGLLHLAQRGLRRRRDALQRLGRGAYHHYCYCYF